MNDISQKRYKFDNFLKTLGLVAIVICCLFLFLIFGSIIFKSIPAFISYKVQVNVADVKNMNEEKAVKFLQKYSYPINYLEIFSVSAAEELVHLSQKKTDGKFYLTAAASVNNSLELKKKFKIRAYFNYNFFFSAESREPELAGLATSIIGSIYTVLICLLVSCPVAVLAAIYLEEFAPKNLFTSLIEVNINNLAAVPSIVFGLLGLAVLINIIGLPRSSSIVAGLTLAMMTLPLIIITTRQAFRTIPIAIKHGALALGATKMQVILHHTLPLSLPGIMTGIILSIARAIGETAPLILIGMVAFIVDIPTNAFDPATVMPVQIYLWANSPESQFQAKTAAAILILLGILVIINAIVVYIRKKYEYRW